MWKNCSSSCKVLYISIGSCSDLFFTPKTYSCIDYYIYYDIDYDDHDDEFNDDYDDDDDYKYYNDSYDITMFSKLSSWSKKYIQPKKYKDNSLRWWDWCMKDDTKKEIKKFWNGSSSI